MASSPPKQSVDDDHYVTMQLVGGNRLNAGSYLSTYGSRSPRPAVSSDRSPRSQSLLRNLPANDVTPYPSLPKVDPFRLQDDYSSNIPDQANQLVDAEDYMPHSRAYSSLRPTANSGRLSPSPLLGYGSSRSTNVSPRRGSESPSPCRPEPILPPAPRRASASPSVSTVNSEDMPKSRAYRQSGRNTPEPSESSAGRSSLTTNSLSGEEYDSQVRPGSLTRRRCEELPSVCGETDPGTIINSGQSDALAPAGAVQKISANHSGLSANRLGSGSSRHPPNPERSSSGLSANWTSSAGRSSPSLETCQPSNRTPSGSDSCRADVADKKMSSGPGRSSPSPASRSLNSNLNSKSPFSLNSTTLPAEPPSALNLNNLHLNSNPAFRLPDDPSVPHSLSFPTLGPDRRCSSPDSNSASGTPLQLHSESMGPPRPFSTSPEAGPMARVGSSSPSVSVFIIPPPSNLTKSPTRTPRASGSSIGFDDHEFAAGDLVDRRYEVEECLGKGSFGTVYRAWDKREKRPVALKYLRKDEKIKDEVEILQKIAQLDPDGEKNVARLLSHCKYKKRDVLVFELLGLDLRSIARVHKSVPNPSTLFLSSQPNSRCLTLQQVQRVARQMLVALEFLSSPTVGIIHRDIKPDNILTSDEDISSVKLADFGTACYIDSPAVTATYVQSRSYRPPEVLLGRPYTPAADMWSLACVLVGMHIGEDLFIGLNVQEQLAEILKVLGPPPGHLIETSPKGWKYFSNVDGQWRLVSPAKNTELGSRALSSILGSASGGPNGQFLGVYGHSAQAYERFEDFLRLCLQYDPSQRASPSEALAHRFFSASSPEF